MMNTPRSPQVALFERLPGKPLVEGSTCLFPAGRSSNTLSSPSQKRHQPPALTCAVPLQRTLQFQSLMKTSENQQQGCTTRHPLLPECFKSKWCQSWPKEAFTPDNARSPRQLLQESLSPPCLRNHQLKRWQ